MSTLALDTVSGSRLGACEVESLFACFCAVCNVIGMRFEVKRLGWWCDPGSGLTVSLQGLRDCNQSVQFGIWGAQSNKHVFCTSALLDSTGAVLGC